MRRLLTALALCWYGLSAGAQHTVRGQVLDEQNQPLSDAVLRVEGSRTAAQTNNEGLFALNLPAGRWTIRVQYIGYQTLTQAIDVPTTTPLRLRLTPEEVRLDDVVITPDGRDPAYAIIAKARDRRDAHKKQTPNYTYRAYTRTRIDLTETPQLLRKSMKKDLVGMPDSGAYVLYLAENISEVAVQEPDHIRETIVATRVSGDSGSYSLFSSLFLRFNIYDNLVDLGGVAERGFVSPVADQTFFFYDFKLLGTVQDDGQTIYRIRVLPKRRHDPAFDGVVWIADSSYAIHGYELGAGKRRPLQFVDSVVIRQTMTAPVRGAWMPGNIKFAFSGKTLGVGFGGYSTSTFSAYQIVETFAPKTFSNQILAVADSALGRDANYWDEARPVPLDSLESVSDQRMDSLDRVQRSPAYLDSLTRAGAAFKSSHLYSSYRYFNYRNDNELRVRSPLGSLSYNTMEGVVAELDVHKTWNLRNKRRSLMVNPMLRYGFASERWLAQAEVIYEFGNRRMGGFTGRSDYIRAAGGDYVTQFGPNAQLTPLQNTLYSLCFERNYLRLYHRQYALLETQKELFNGVIPKAGVTWERRSPLPNRTDYVMFPQESRSFSPNFDFVGHDAVIFYASLDLVIQNKYVKVPEGKLNFGSNWPRFRLNYRKGLADVDYDFVGAEVRDDRKLGLLGELHWQAEAGSFVNDRTVAFADYQHFRSNQTFYRPIGQIAQFSLQNYYSYSAGRSYFAVHAEHHFDGFILNKIPLVRRLKWRELIGAHYLNADAHGDYLEVHAGIQNIFQIFRVDIHHRVLGKSYVPWGVTVGWSNFLGRR